MKSDKGRGCLGHGSAIAIPAARENAQGNGTIVRTALWNAISCGERIRTAVIILRRGNNGGIED